MQLLAAVVFPTQSSLGRDPTDFRSAGYALSSLAACSCPPAHAHRYTASSQRPAQITVLETHLLTSRAFDLAIAALGTLR